MMNRFAQLTHYIRGRIDELPGLGPLSRRDARLWRQVENLEDIGELTAQWLEGDIETQPGYYGRPDPETDELVPALADLNRSGYVTYGSQPGEGPIRGYDDEWWWQRAAVEGFAHPETANRINESSTASGLTVVQHDQARWRTSYNDTIDVTRSGPDETPEPGFGRSQVHTAFGAHLSTRAMLEVFGGTTRAPQILFNTPHVSVVDPRWGRNDLLWPTLTGALHRSRDVDERCAGPAEETITRGRIEINRVTPDPLGQPERWDQP